MADKQTKRVRDRQKLILSTAVLILTMAVIVLGVRYTRALAEIKKLSDPQEAQMAEARNYRDAVADLVDLPEDEVPSIATVTDPSKVKDQPFFAKAELGDKVLIFSQAKKVVLYRPSTDRVIEVSRIGENGQIQ